MSEHDDSYEPHHESSPTDHVRPMRDIGWR